MTSPGEPVPDPAEPSGPAAVSRFEYHLLRILRFLLGHMPADQAVSLLGTKFYPAPPCLSRTCVRLVEDMLAKGLVLHLVRAGGWRNERYLRGGKPVGGRVWERNPLDERALTFSRHSLGLLFWLTAEKPGETKAAWDAPAAELTPGDELFFAVAFESLRPLQDVAQWVAGRWAFRQNALCWLNGPGDFAPLVYTPPPFAPWFAGTRAAILECLQTDLTRRWTRGERAKGQIGDWKRMRQQGEAEQQTLTAFLAAAEQANRPDLARFLLRSMAAVFAAGDLAPSFWTGGLQGQGPPRLADRLETQRAALAVPRQMQTLQAWDRRSRSVGYFDEDYPASQLWKEDWEAARGDEVTAKAQRVLDQLEPLRT